MSENWPGNWYQDEEPGRPEAGPQGSSSARAQPRFTPSQEGRAPDDKWENAWGSATYGHGAGAGASGAGASGSAWPMQPPPRSGRSGSGGPTGPSGPTRPRGWRRWLRPKRILTIIAALVALAIVATVAVYFSVNSKLTRINVLVPTSLTSAGTNWLIAGSDSRGGLTAAQENQLALGRDITGSRSDTIMLLHLPANGTRPTLVSIPRDSYVPIPGVGDNKINAAYALGGPKLLIETVQNVTRLHINHFMSIGFGGLVDVVNDVGGVRMCLTAPMKDPKAGLNLKAGCQNLNGSQALGFVRTRAFSEGDLQREQDQRVLLKGILSKLTSTGTLINPFAVIPAANGAAAAISVDSSTGLSQLVSVAFALRNPVTTTVPFGGFANTSAGSVVEWNTTAAKQFFSDLGHDVALPKNLITVTSVQGTA
jgi:LCP family protein required for cell wall assembly